MTTERITGFTILAGAEVHAALEAEKAAHVQQSGGLWDSEQLCRLHEQQSRRGVVGAELVKSIYGWGLRYNSGLQNFGIIARAQEIGGSLEAGKAYAEAWVAKDPTRRYVTANNYYLAQGDTPLGR